MSAPQRVSAGPGGLTRVTISGTRRRADLVLPSTEPLGLLLPDLVGIVAIDPEGDLAATSTVALTVVTPGARVGGHQLSLVDGTVLDLGASLADAGVRDGTIIRLDAVSEAPPAPILHDVADHVADTALVGRWDDRSRTVAAVLAAAAGGAAAAALAAPAAGPVAVLVVGALLLVAGLGTALGGNRAPGAAVLAAGAAAALVAVPGLPEPARVPVAALVAGLAAVAAAGAGRAPRAAVTGGIALVAQLGPWWALGTTGMRLVDVAAVMSIVAVLLLGVLPRVAVATSGLAALDDRHSVDEPVTRSAATAALAAAHQGLALACAITAVSAAAAGWTLARAPHPVPVWPVVLACLVVAALLLRLRAYPLAAEVGSLLVAAGVVVWGVIGVWPGAGTGPGWAGAGVAAAVVVVAVGVLAARPRRHVLARARQLADRLEALVVVAVVPVAVGTLGVYEQLLEAF